jgi:hypothetical protein
MMPNGSLTVIPLYAGELSGCGFYSTLFGRSTTLLSLLLIISFTTHYFAIACAFTCASAASIFAASAASYGWLFLFASST